MHFEYLTQPPKRYTFEQPELKRWAESWCQGSVLNLFAGFVKLAVNEFRVDLDPSAPADFHGDAFDFISGYSGAKFDTVVFDPPYNMRKSREKYGARYFGSLAKIKDSLPSIINVGGRVISFGYDSVGLSRRRGFDKIAICLVCHNGDHNDTICVVETYIQPDLFGTKTELYGSVSNCLQQRKAGSQSLDPNAEAALLPC